MVYPGWYRRAYIPRVYTQHGTRRDTQVYTQHDLPLHTQENITDINPSHPPRENITDINLPTHPGEHITDINLHFNHPGRQ